MPRPLLAARSAIIRVLLLLVASEGAWGAEWPPRDGLRVVFLGDSITQDGTYVRYMDAYLETRFPDRKIEVINLGLSSETLSGLTEPVHPYPRPDVRARLARALEMTKPNIVFVCYGMNDGIYAPPDPARIGPYRRGVATVVEAIKAAGAEVIIGTPPPFDPRPIRPKTAPLSASGFGYSHPYIDYDGVLGLYADLLLTKRVDGWTVADIHGATRDALNFLRAADPNFTLAQDGVHPMSDGHWLIARPFLEAWGAGANAEVDVAAVDAKNREVLRGQVELIPSAAEDDSFRLAWATRIPLPRDPSWDPRLIAFERIDDRFNRHRLTMVGLPKPRYAIYEDDRNIGEATRGELAEGLDLLRFSKLSTNRRSAEVWPLIEHKHRVTHSAWLEAVGHGPPLFGRALPLDEAERQSAAIVEKIRNLTRPVPIRLRFVPIGG